jgi:hypothetical protein
MKIKNKEIWVADSETDPFDYDVIPVPFIWGLYNGNEYHEFTDTDKFVDFVSAKDIIVYAHNGGKFDWHFLSHRFMSGEPLLVIAGRLSRFEIGKCEFRDSINIYAKPLEAFSKEKFDYTKMDKSVRHLYMDEIRTYLKSDCENLFNLVTGFIEQYGLHITTATAAMKFWQYSLPSGRQSVPRSDAGFYDTFRRFYFGGRVQCFEQGDMKVDALSADINSAYPTAMMEQHPYGIFFAHNDGKPRSQPDKWGPMFFDIECVAKGAFCYRGINGVLYYPDDNESRIYHVTGWELIAALETNTIRKLKFLSYYEFGELKSFAEYVNHFWKARLQFKADGDKHGSDFAKLMMNSLYGKFGSNPEKYKEHFLLPKQEFYEHYIETLSDMDSWKEFREWVIVSRAQDNSKKKFFNLATAASITGFVRAKLWRAIVECDTPYYCDTDSITAKGFGESVVIGTQLGEWEIEYKYDRVIICGKKLYAFHHREKKMNDKASWKIASKGARLNYADLIKVASGQVVTFRNMAPTFSVSKVAPTFISRDIKATAGDSRVVPRKFDPKYVT